MALLEDLRHTVHGLLRTPGYVVAVVITLGLAIGANSAIFSLIRGVLLQPLPHRDGDRLVYLRQSAALAGVENVTFSVPEIVDYRTQSNTLMGVAEFSALTFTVLGLDEPRRVRAGIVTGNYFNVMGLRSVAGRVFDAGDDGEAAAPVAVLQHAFWQRAFGGDRGVVGKTISMNGRTVTIVGVLQPAPPYPEETSLYVNMVASPHHLSAAMNHNRVHRMTEVFARLAPGATMSEARSELERIAARLRQAYPEAYDRTVGYAVSVTPLREQLTRRARPTLLLLLGAAAFVLLIAVANVASLTVTRVVRRQRELVIRASLGATLWQLRSQLLTESFLLAITGAALGLGIALGGLNALKAFAARYTIRAAEVSLDSTVFVFALGIALVAAVVFALVPAVPDARKLGTSLADPGLRTTGGLGWRRAQRILVVAQVAVSFVLLIGAGLLFRSLVALQQVDPGFSARNILTLDIPTPFDGRSPDARRQYYKTIIERVRALPGVEAAALTTSVPLRDGPSTFTSSIELRIEGRDAVAGAPTPRAAFRPVSPDYFATLGVRLAAGRTFAATDGPDQPRVVIISQAMADYYFPNQSPLGKRLAWAGDQLQFLGLSDEWRTIVGVAPDVRDHGLDRAPAHNVYHPFAQEALAGSLMLRTAGDPAPLRQSVRRVIRDFAPDQPIERMATVEQIRSDGTTARRLNVLLIGGFALLALVIAGVGVAGVLGFSVSHRTRELGIRAALGADRRRLLSSVLSEGATLGLVGLLFGGSVAVAVSRSITSLLYGVQPTDPTTFAGVALILLGIAVAASIGPAWRAARVQPAEVLVAE